MSDADRAYAAATAYDDELAAAPAQADARLAAARVVLKARAAALAAARRASVVAEAASTRAVDDLARAETAYDVAASAVEAVLSAADLAALENTRAAMAKETTMFEMTADNLRYRDEFTDDNGLTWCRVESPPMICLDRQVMTFATTVGVPDPDVGDPHAQTAHGFATLPLSKPIIIRGRS